MSWNPLYSPAEIREDKDRHIAGRMQQFAKDDTVSVRKCPVVKEYQDSGRADVKASEDEKCTKGQVRREGGREYSEHCRFRIQMYTCDEKNREVIFTVW